MGEELKLEYTVAIGDGSFPFDMLRVDQCFPACCDHCSWHLDGDENEEERFVILGRYMRQSDRWTPDQWDHYGWTLLVYNGRGFDRLEDAKYAANMFLKGKEAIKGT